MFLVLFIQPYIIIAIQIIKALVNEKVKWAVDVKVNGVRDKRFIVPILIKIINKNM
jgi:hypothetical protein